MVMKCLYCLEGLTVEKNLLYHQENCSTAYVKQELDTNEADDPLGPKLEFVGDEICTEVHRSLFQPKKETPLFGFEEVPCSSSSPLSRGSANFAEVPGNVKDNDDPLGLKLEFVGDQSSAEVQRPLFQPKIECEEARSSSALNRCRENFANVVENKMDNVGIGQGASAQLEGSSTECKESVEQGDLRIHERSRENPYSCDFCEKRFSTSSNLAVHIRMHTGGKSYSCDFCDKRFSRLDHKAEHIRTHTGEKPYSCDFCEKRFSASSYLAVHIRMHTGEKPYSCDFCDKRFSRSSDKVNHVRTHTGEKPYSCDVCNKSFSRSCFKLSHMRRHTGEKPHSCDICEKVFSWPHEKTQHMRTHTGEKPYSCDFCEKSFSRLHHKVEHTRTHTGEKPYSCDVCEKVFSRSSEKTEHMIKHTGEKPCVL